MKNPIHASLLSALAFVFLVSVGFMPYLRMAPEKAGQFGDSFGFINAFISGLAFIGLVWTVYLQNRGLESSTKGLADQLALAQKTARIQALTFLAEWHYRMVRETPGDQQEVNKKKCQYFAARAIDLLAEIGEAFPGDPGAVGIVVPTDRELAARDLDRLRRRLEDQLRPHWNKPNTRRANEILGQAEHELVAWAEKYRDRLDVSVVNNCLGLLRQPRKNHTEDSKPELVAAYWASAQEILDGLGSVIGSLEHGD